jgi:hypothetical protein
VSIPDSGKLVPPGLGELKPELRIEETNFNPGLVSFFSEVPNEAASLRVFKIEQFFFFHIDSLCEALKPREMQ